MKYVLKFAGIFAVVLCCSLSGFIRTRSKKEYIRRLKKIDAGLSRADDMLRLGGGGKSAILSACFSDVEGFTVSADGAVISPAAAGKEAADLLNPFFAGFGSGDELFEHRRIARTRHLLCEVLSREEKGYAQFARIWQTAGICAGFALGIMLI